MAQYLQYGVETKVVISNFHKDVDGMTGTILGFHIEADCPEGQEDNPDYVSAIVLFDEPPEDMALASNIPLECLEPLVTN